MSLVAVIWVSCGGGDAIRGAVDAGGDLSGGCGQVLLSPLSEDASVSCVFAFPALPPYDDLAIVVSANEGPTKVPEDPTNGWSFTDSTLSSIALNGSACADLESGAYSDVTAYFCPERTGTLLDRGTN